MQLRYYMSWGERGFSFISVPAKSRTAGFAGSSSLLVKEEKD